MNIDARAQQSAARAGLGASPGPLAVAFLLFAAGVVLTLLVTHLLREQADDRGADRFRAEARQLAARIEGRMQAHAALLAAAGGLFQASDHVDGKDWSNFVGALNVPEQYPGLHGLGFARRVERRDLEKVQAALRREHGANATIRPAGERAEYYPLTLVEPRNARNAVALGSDLAMEPARRAAMDAALASGGVGLTGPILLESDGAGGVRPSGVILLQPIFDPALPRRTVDERRAAVRGFVTAAFRISDLAASVIGQDPPDFAFRLVDRGGLRSSDSVLFDRQRELPGPGAEPIVQTLAFAFGGRVWALEARAGRGYGVEAHALQERALLLAGLVLSAVPALLALMVARTRARAARLAQAMTRDLEVSRSRFERMVAGSSDGVWEFDPRSGATYLSPRLMELLGFEAEEAHRSRDWMPGRVHEDDRAAALAAFKGMIRTGRVFDMRLRMRLRDGAYRWFRVRGKAFTARHDGTVLVSGSLSDVHEDHEARLRESRLLRIIELSPDMFMTFDLEGRPTYLNPAARRVFGEIGAGRLSGASIASVFAQNEVDRVFNEGVPTAYMQDFWESETELITIDGEVMPVSQVILSHKTESGQVEFYSTVMRDISALRSALEDLRRTRERLQRALDGANDGIWERNVETGEFFTSDRLAEMLGYPPERMPRTVSDWKALVHPDDKAISDAAVARMVDSDESVVWDTRMRTGSGDYRWMRRRGRAVRDTRGTVTATAGTLSDIHDARMAEEALKELQARYRRVLDGSNDGIWEMDEVANAYYCSPRLCEILGWHGEGVPRTREQMRANIHPEDLQAHGRAVEVMHRGGAAYSWDVRMLARDGNYRWLRFRGIASRDVSGRVVLCSGTASDIHEARLAEDELKRHRDNLAQLVEERTAGLEIARREAEAQRSRAEASREVAERANLAKSEFLANMSHELRTPMHAIISFANFGVDRHDRAERDKLLHYFRNIQKSGSRLLTLLNDLLDLSKLEAGKMQIDLAPLQPATLVAEAIGESEAFAQGRGVRLRATAALEVGEVRWDGARLLQVLRNLISNAVKFSPPGGEVAIEMLRARVRTGRRAEDPIVDGVEIRVRDAGIGIPDDELETVFDKFVQSSKTKTGAGGTGLGLAICREIVLAQFGTIHAENNPAPACGATFVVRLPVDPDGARARRDCELEAVP